MKKEEILKILRREIMLEARQLEPCDMVEQILTQGDRCPLEVCHNCNSRTSCRFGSTLHLEKQLWGAYPENDWERHVALSALFRALRIILSVS